jgi:hypothetical protein
MPDFIPEVVAAEKRLGHRPNEPGGLNDATDFASKKLDLHLMLLGLVRRFVL